MPLVARKKYLYRSLSLQYSRSSMLFGFRHWVPRLRKDQRPFNGDMRQRLAGVVVSSQTPAGDEVRNRRVLRLWQTENRRQRLSDIPLADLSSFTGMKDRRGIEAGTDTEILAASCNVLHNIRHTRLSIPSMLQSPAPVTSSKCWRRGHPRSCSSKKGPRVVISEDMAT